MHLAQLNVSWLRHPLDHPDLAPFVSAFDDVLAQAADAPGFVWRWTERTSLPRTRLFGADSVVNLSLWAGPEELRSFVVAGRHLALLRQRSAFFRRHEGPSLVLWWVEEGRRPTLSEARERLDLLAAEGPGPRAFTLARLFDPA